MKNIFVSPNLKIIQAMKRLGEVGERCLIVVDEKKKLLGTLNDGDIRRGILQGMSIKKSIKKLYSTKPTVLVKGKYKLDEAKKILSYHKQNLNLLPILDKNRIVVDYLSWDNVFASRKKITRLDKVPIVVMAGGKGDRLIPFTKVLPKPLIPVNEKPVIEHIIEKFTSFGAKKFYITTNYKSRILKSFFKELQPSYSVKFFDEIKPLGTIGGLRNHKKNFKGSFFVTNCDIIINSNYSDIYNFHKNNKNDMTLVASAKDFEIPYGICKLDKKGQLLNIIEKPKQNFLANTGLYVLNSRVLNLIPKNKFFHMTDLIKVARKKKMQIGIYPIEDSNWLDVGQWSEYTKTSKIFS